MAEVFPDPPGVPAPAVYLERVDVMYDRDAYHSLSVRAVLGHWLFGYIHPFPNGNGRVARFVMNAMLVSGGYPWTVIRTEERLDYMSAFEAASVEQEIEPFAVFIAGCVKRAVGEFE